MGEVYSVACRGSMNEKATKCFRGGGWLVERVPAACPHCGKEMFVTQRIESVHLGGPTEEQT